MNLYIKRDEIYKTEKAMLEVTAQWLEQLGQLKAALIVMVNTTAMEGRAADSIRTYIMEEPIAILDALNIGIELFRAKMLVCAEGYETLDSNGSAQISCERLTEICQTLDQGARAFYDTREAVVKKLNTVSDIFPAGTLSIAPYHDYESLKHSIGQLKTDIAAYEEVHIHDMDDVEDLLSKLSAALVAAMSRTAVQIGRYSSGKIPSEAPMKGLSDTVLTATCHISDAAFQEKLREANDRFQIRLDEERAKERQEKGLTTVLTGIGAVIAGAVCIVATWGAATPLVVAGFAAGGTAIGFGVSESIEGAQDIYYGAIGDLDSVSFNPIRDTVFASNPELYYTIGKISTLTSVLIAGGVTLAGVGSSLLAEGATTAQAVKGVALEAGKMVGSGFVGDVAGRLTYEATGNENIAILAGAGAGMASGGLANRFLDTKSLVGLNKISDQISIIHQEYNDSFTEKSIIIKRKRASDVNQWFRDEFAYEAPYKPGTEVRIHELSKNSTGEYCRVYDKVNSRAQGGWVLRKKDIIGLSPEQIQKKYSLPYEPKYLCDVEFPKGTIVREGEANAAFGFDGGGTQFDTIGLNKGFVGSFFNERMIVND